MTLRRCARWVVGVLGLVACAPLVVNAAQNFHKWRATLNDASAKDAYLTFLEGDLILISLVALATTFGFRLTVARPEPYVRLTGRRSSTGHSS